MAGLRSKLISSLILCVMYSFLNSQEASHLNLQKCLDLAFEYNLAYQNALQQAANADARKQSAAASLLPSVSGFANQGISTGKSINPYTNTFINQEVTTGQYGLSASLSLFNGFSNWSNLQQSHFAKKATNNDVLQARLELQMQVTQAYVQVLAAEELINQAASQLASTSEQLTRLQTLQQQGAITPSLLHDTRGQLANDKIAAIQASSTLVNARMALSELINQEIPASTSFEKLNTELSAESADVNADELYASTKERSPMVQAGNYRLRSAHSGLRSTWGSAFPSLALVGNVGSNYSSAAVRQSVVGSYYSAGTSYVMLNGSNSPVYDRQLEYASEKIGFNNQLSNNLFTYIGLSLQVPLFNGLRTKQQIDINRHAYDFSKVQQKSASTRFRAQLTVACNELKNAREKCLVYEEQAKDYQLSYSIAQSRFERGAISSLEFISAKTNVEKAQANAISAKYEYVFRKKVVDLYLAL